MQNYSQVFQDTINEFESPYVSGDQGDAGKGQVCARAGYKIFTSMNANVGYIAKSGGQTQYYGIAVDALIDRSDATGADFLTDELQPDGRRLIRVAYTAYAPPVPGTPIPPTNWVQPTEDMLTHGGPLTLKGGSVPTPEPTPPPDDERLDAIWLEVQAISQTLATMQEQQDADTKSILEAVNLTYDAVKHFEDRFNQIVEDVEQALLYLVPLLIILLRDDEAADRRRARGAPSAAADAASQLHAWVAQRKARQSA